MRKLPLHFGANRVWTFSPSTLPLALPGVLAGMVLAFAKSLGEFGATITLVFAIPGETQTISAAIYALTQTPQGDGPALLRLAVISTIIALICLVASDRLARRVAARVRGD